MRAAGLEEEGRIQVATAPPKTPLSKFVEAPLQVLAGIVGASALFAALASLAGWQYTRSYYETLGIPFSALDFSTQDYLFATLPSMTLALAVMLGVVAGVGYGLLAGKWAFDGWGIVVTLLVLTLLVLIGPLPAMGLDLTNRMGPFGWEILALVWAMLFLSVLAGFLGLYFLQPKTERAPLIYTAPVSVSVLVLLAAVLTVAPPYIGRVVAEDNSSHYQDYQRARLVVVGKVGADDPRTPLQTSTHEQLVQAAPDSNGATQSCAERIPMQKSVPPEQLCELTNVVVILHNNKQYFLSDAESMDPKLRKIYVVPEDRIVRIVFEAQ